MSQICETHNLALATDGKCVLCRRAERPAVLVERRVETTGDKVVTVLLLGCMVVATASLVWLLQQPAPTAQLAGEETSLGSGAGPKPTRKPVAVQVALSDGGTTDAGVPDAGSPKATTAEQVEALTDGEVASARRARIEAARAKVKVTMYSTQWCTICDAARYYLQAARVEFIEARIDLDEGADKRLGKLNRAKTVPTFSVNDEVLVGYNAYEIEAKINDAAGAGAGESIAKAKPVKGDDADTKKPAR